MKPDFIKVYWDGDWGLVSLKDTRWLCYCYDLRRGDFCVNGDMPYVEITDSDFWAIDKTEGMTWDDIPKLLKLYKNHPALQDPKARVKLSDLNLHE